MLNLLLRMGGVLAFLGTGVALVVLLALFLYGVGRRNLALARRSVLGAIAIVLVYLGALAAGLLLGAHRELLPGDELSFCGFDCHLHVTAMGVAGDTVLMRFRSDALVAPEFPSHLRIRAADDHGTQVAPVAPLPDIPLRAGDTLYRRVRFALAPGRRLQHISVTWGDWPDYLVPGPQNAMVQERTVIRLAAGP